MEKNRDNQDQTLDQLDNSAEEYGISQDYADFVVSNESYYLPKFAGFEKKNKIISWNWAAFWLGMPFWCIYRKMYGVAVAVFIMYIFLPVPFIPLAILGAMFANYLYYRVAKKKIAEIRKKYPDNPEEASLALMAKGGTNLAGGIIFLAAMIIVVCLLYILGSLQQVDS